jgi:hypothetical protein
MGFIVQSVSKRTGEPPYRMTKATKKDALDAAIGLLAQGMKDVTITDEQGQIYSTSEFVDLIENPPRNSGASNGSRLRPQ